MNSYIMTKRDALRWCRKLWLWNSKHPDTDKWQSPLPVRKWVSGCPCCSYVENVKGIGIGDFDKCVKVCPLGHLWPNGCEKEPSPYHDYLYANEAHKNVTKEQIQYIRSWAAGVIAEACKEGEKDEHTLQG